MNLTNFPESVDTFPNYLDILATDGALIAQYYQAIQQGDQPKAMEILQQIPAYTQKRITATDLNKLMQAVLAVERFYKTNVEPYTEEMQIAWQEIIDQLDYKGTYSSGTSYQQNNIVSYTVGGLMQLYIATDEVPVGTPPTNTAYWRVLTIRGAKGDSGEGVSFAGEWNASQSYSINNLVTHNNALWNSLAPNTNQEPQEGSTYWQKTAEFPTVVYPVQEEQPTGQQAGELWFHVTKRGTPPPYIVTTTQPFGTQIASGIATLNVSKIKELADAIAAEPTVDNNAETVYVWVTAENGYYTISIGDIISWTMNGTSYPYRIMGFNHYDKADGSGKAGILFQMVDCFNTEYPMKYLNTSGDGWDDSLLRTTLNSTLYGYLPSDVQSAISQVFVKTATDVSTSTIISTIDKLFVPAEVEVFGSTSYAKGGTNEGVWYPWYKANNNASSRVKKVNGSANNWWERSPYNWDSASGLSGFCCVNNIGFSKYDDAINSYGVAPCFCF